MKKEKKDINDADDHMYYTPKFFKRVEKHAISGDEYYEFVEQNNKDYWAERDKGKWANQPKIFEKGCKPFY